MTQNSPNHSYSTAKHSYTSANPHKPYHKAVYDNHWAQHLAYASYSLAPDSVY